MLSTSSSYSDLSVLIGPPSEADTVRDASLALMREISAAATRNSSPAPPTYPATSAKYHMRPTKIVIDFHVARSEATEPVAPPPPPPPPPVPAAVPVAGPADADTTLANTTTNNIAAIAAAVAAATAAEAPAATQLAMANVNGALTQAVSWSCDNVLAFTRGNRIQVRHFASNKGEESAQFCKIPKDAGALRIISWAGPAHAGTIAAATDKGFIQLWDLQSRKKSGSWVLNGGISGLAWCGPVLTVAQPKGFLRHYDTRIDPKKQGKIRAGSAKRVIAHHSTVRSLTWNDDGKLLASGDESGRVYVWDTRARETALDFGEFDDGLHNQRTMRRRIQHSAPVRVRNLCPLSSHSRLICLGLYL